MKFALSRDDDTICAVSTPPGVGGLSVIRVSGNQAVSHSRPVLRFLPDTLESHRVYYGFCKIHDEDKEIDEVLVSFFEQGRSFTTEETLEISCHGNQQIVSMIIEELNRCGVRLAEPGEFTYRAFINGRIDLVQAEAVLGLIESQSRKAADLALNQLKGSLSRELRGICDEVLWCLANLEAAIDFSTEDIEVGEYLTIQQKLERCSTILQTLLDSAKLGRVLSHGVEVAIVGAPNVGKSSLLNYIADEEKAIVTDVPGTTRDVVEVRTQMNGVDVCFFDTAGIRPTDDPVERLGIQKSIAKAKSADFVVFMGDVSLPATRQFEDVLSLVGSNAQPLFIFNKIDLDTDFSAEVFNERGPVHLMSLKNRQGVDGFLGELNQLIKQVSGESHSAVLTSARQVESVSAVANQVREAMALVQANESPEVVAFVLNEALFHLQRLLGLSNEEAVMDRIFSDFCLGK